MRVARVIPCLDVDAGRVVKGVNFVGLRDAGDPVELAARYDAEGADELVFLDITASSDARDTIVDVARRTAEEVFIPFTVGGGIRTRRRRPPPAARRRRQGVGEHRRRRPARARRRDRRGVRRQCAVVAIDARAASTGGLRGLHPRRADADRPRRRRRGPRRSSRSAPARSCSPRWTATAPATASTSS